MNKFVALGASEIKAVRELTRIRRTVRINETLVREDRKPDRIYLILKGVAVRYRYLIDGRRQIFGYLLPGELCDTQFVINDFTLIAPYIKAGGIVIFHDTHPSRAGHLNGSYDACVQLRRRGYDIQHIEDCWWGYWRKP